jgi:hypothetical protein
MQKVKQIDKHAPEYGRLIHMLRHRHADKYPYTQTRRQISIHTNTQTNIHTQTHTYTHTHTHTHTHTYTHTLIHTHTHTHTHAHTHTHTPRNIETAREIRSSLLVASSAGNATVIIRGAGYMSGA